MARLEESPIKNAISILNEYFMKIKTSFRFDISELKDRRSSL